MPQIKLISPGQPVADFSVSGAVVTVAGITVDCADRQHDAPHTIEIRQHQGVAVEGGLDGAFLAQITIPCRAYNEVATEEDGKPGMRREPIPLDANAITVTLWPAA